MNKKYRVVLAPEQRQTLESLIRTGSAPAQTQSHARILLKADCGADGAAWGDAAIAQACDVSIPTVERVRRAFVTRGLDAALQRKRWVGPSRRKLDGQQEAHLVALTCSPPPDGAERWTLALLADKLVTLNVVASITPETVRRVLKKTNSNRG
jgi:transposase